MDVQFILVIALFIAAAAYIGRLIFKSVGVKDSGCGSNCKCGVDFENMDLPKK